MTRNGIVRFTTSALLSLSVVLGLLGCQPQSTAPAAQTPLSAAGQAGQSAPAAPAQASVAAPTKVAAAAAPIAPTQAPVAAAPQGRFDEAKFKDLITAAKKEGEVLVYGLVAQSTMDLWLKGFYDKFGIKGSSWRGTSPQLRERFAADVQAGRAPDILSLGVRASEVEPWLQGKWLMPYTTANDKLYPKSFKEIGEYASPILLTESAVTIVNPAGLKPDELKAIAEKPLEGLLLPSLKGRIAITDPGATGGALLTIYWLLEEYRSTFGEEYLKKLAAQQPKIYQSGTQGAEAVARGEFDAAISAATGALTLLDKGAKIQFFYPDPAPSQVSYAMAASKAAHPNAARLFLEWVTSYEGQDYTANEVFFIRAALPGVPDRRTVAKEPWYKPGNLALAKDSRDLDAKTKGVIDRFQTIFNYKPN